MQRIVFSSAELPAHLEDRARFSLWRDTYVTCYGQIDIQRSDNGPFFAEFEFAQFAGLGLGRFTGTVNRLSRSRSEAAQSPSDDLCLAVNRGGSTMSFAHRGCEAALAPGAATLFNYAEPGAVLSETESAWFAVIAPRKDLLTFVPDAEDVSGRPLDQSLPALRLLRGYCDVVGELDGADGDPALTAHIGSTLFDLIALALGSTRDGAEIARTRGLRAARLQSIIAEIKGRFADPALTVRLVASKVGLSERYVQNLLYQAGASFTERVLELRLQKARAMLADRRHDRLRISDIAYECGFDSLSYFNRRFRRRFGAPPTQYRGNGGAPD